MNGHTATARRPDARTSASAARARALPRPRPPWPGLRGGRSPNDRTRRPWRLAVSLDQALWLPSFVRRCPYRRDMFGSQALDTAIGLVLMLFVLATAASSILELINRLARTRAKNLERALGLLLGGAGNGGADATAALAELRHTSVYAAATASSDGKAPAYLSAKAF